VSVVLRSEVGVVEGFFGFHKPAVMDLHDDGRFVLVRVDRRSHEFGEMIFDSPVDALSVGGASTYLTITANGKKKRVDFSTSSPVGIVELGLIGYAIAATNASAAGLPNWVAVFKQRGLLRRYSNTNRNLKVLGIIAASIVGLFVILLVVLSVVTATLR
jgi:hypothetical protein